MMTGFLASLSAVPPPGWDTGLLRDIWINLIHADRYMMLLRGLGLTLQIAAAGITIGIILGFIIAMMRLSRFPVLRTISRVYVSIIRGIPMLVQLLIWTFVIFASPGFPKLIICFIAFGVNSGAYVSEIFRAGILSVDRGQTEAGRSVGLSSSKTMRLIVFPQAFKNALPPLVNEFIILFKDTSIVGFIGVQDMTRMANVILTRTFNAFIPLLTAALLYLIVVIILTWLMGKLERRLRVSDKR